MNKKRKPRSAARKGAGSTLSPAALADLARQDLENGRYREAIANYKSLLKQADTDLSLHTGLAEAYAGRARQLEAKGLLKEALVMWEHRQQLVGNELAFETDHLLLLLRLGQFSALLSLYLRECEQWPPATRLALASQLAARVAAGDEAIIGAIPDVDPLQVEGRSACAALSSYCAGDDAAMNAALAAIPYRSAYRDLVQILRALSLATTDRDEARARLARTQGQVTPGFARLHRAAWLALVPESDLSAGLAGADEWTRGLALTMRGWDATRQALWRDLRGSGSEPSELDRLRVIFRHRERLGEERVRRLGLRLLVEPFPSSRGWFAEVGGGRLSSEEQDLLEAWCAEGRGDLGEVIRRWQTYAEHLKRPGAGEPGSDSALRVALVLRRPEAWSGVLAGVAAGSPVSPSARRLAAMIEESLVYDPDDAESYQWLIRLRLADKAYKDARRLFEQASVRWPRDVKLLLAGMELAIATGAFKKASGIARRVLELDPINGAVRERLVEAHLAHARKQSRSRPDLARRELDAAREWAKDERLRELCDLVAAFLTFAEDPVAGRSQLQDIARRSGGGLRGALAVALEATAFGHKGIPLLKSLGLIPVASVHKDALLAFLASLRTLLDKGRALPKDVGKWLETALKASAVATLSMSEADAACETLRRAGLDGARLAFAKTSLKQWRGQPIFELHRFEATHKGNYRRVGHQDLDRLGVALRKARLDGDERTAHRIEEALIAAEDAMFGPGPFGGGPFGDPMADLDPGPLIRAMIDLIGLDGLFEVIDLPPKERRKFKELEREVGREALIDALIAVNRMDGWPGLDKFPLPKPLSVPPKKPRAKPAARKSDAAPDDGATDDPDKPEQFDFFR